MGIKSRTVCPFLEEHKAQRTLQVAVDGVRNTPALEPRPVDMLEGETFQLGDGFGPSDDATGDDEQIPP